MLRSRWLVVVGCIAALGATGFVSAQNSVFIEELTTQEVSAAMKSGKTTVLVPIGGT